MNAAAIATPRVKRQLPPRNEQVKTLQSGEEYDVLIIGGGATGAGCALDSITRGKQTHRRIIIPNSYRNIHVCLIYSQLIRSEDRPDRRRRFCQRYIVAFHQTDSWRRSVFAKGHFAGKTKHVRDILGFFFLLLFQEEFSVLNNCCLLVTICIG